MSTTRRHRPGRGRVFPAALVCFLIVAAIALGTWLQFGERQTLDRVYSAGGSAPDRVDVQASIQRVDAAGRELVLRVLVTPRGELAEAGGVSPTEDLTLQTSTSTRGDLSFKAHSRIATMDLPVTLTGGSITDYPFDTYDAAIEFSATQGGEKVPVHMTLTNGDALFSAGVDASEDTGTAIFDVSLGRSDSVLIFAVFMMVAMWALAVSVLIGAWFLVTRGKGLTWPALGWMAATLFALAAFRNTAPGTPPIGCLLDYIAFLWAETVIAFCLVTVVVTGFKAERRSSSTA
ncbi:DUF4436 family protein [Streptomyces sp. NBC_00094]|uniref:DUF4436 family protein n=1 Tax=Streptomyces sp. NBC_00094 TaxID=2903620 RepID=UPI00224D4470|nr:DUF4436 family protein [Streptomyces sp. NBC_00094]MCX5394999.1 DUF4436 domain-containing protein [Streptomyces sp. NBC_00094]